MTKLEVISRRGKFYRPPVPAPGVQPPIVGDSNAFVESRLTTDVNVQWIWNMNNPAGALATIGGGGSSAHDNADSGGEASLATIRYFEAAPALLNGVNIGNCERLRCPVPSENGSTATNTITYGEYCRRRNAEMALAKFRDLYFRYYVYIPSTFNCYSGGKFPALISIPDSQPLGGYLSSQNTYHDDSWYAGIMFNPPSSQTSFGGAYSGDSNLDHIRVQCYIYANLCDGVAGTQMAIDGHGYQVKARAGLNQDETVANAGGAAVTGTGGYLYLNRGAWNCIEQHVTMNTSGMVNGKYRLWVNDVLALNIQNIRWASDVNNAAAIINCTQFNTFFGGPYGAVTTQTLYKGEFVMSSAKIGPRTAA